MMLNLDTKIALLETHHLYWGANSYFVKGRDFHALSIRVKGDAQITHGEKTEQLTTGSVIFMSKGADYHSKTGEEELFVVHFQTSGPSAFGMQVYNPTNFSRLVDLFSRLHLIFTSKPHGYEFKSLSLFYDILYELKKSENTSLSPNYEKIKNTLDYLHANFTNPELSIKELCKKSFFSDTYFRKLFVSLYGTTPLDYLNNLRLNHAKALLLETNYTVSHVAFLSGFYDEKHFCKLFKQKKGKTPSQHRKGE